MCCAGKSAASLIAAALALAACRDLVPALPAIDPPAADALAPPLGHCGTSLRREVLADGLELLTLPPTRSPAVEIDDPCLRVLRADPSRFRLAIGSEPRKPRPAPRWAEALGAVAVINASMYRPDGRSTGLLIDDKVLAASINDKFGAFLGTAPKNPRSPAVTLWGRSCPGNSLEALRRDYSIVVQNYRLLDCDGSAIRWADEKVYSAAAVGLDRVGRILFIHARAPFKMATFTEMLADPAAGLDLAAAMYVEGGPEATLFVDAGDRRALFVGSYETDFFEHDGNAEPWPLPNVLALVNRR